MADAHRRWISSVQHQKDIISHCIRSQLHWLNYGHKLKVIVYFFLFDDDFQHQQAPPRSMSSTKNGLRRSSLMKPDGPRGALGESTGNNVNVRDHPTQAAVATKSKAMIVVAP